MPQVKEPLKRFTGLVENYRKFRPDYSAEAIAFLIEACGLKAGARVADIGAGTGIFTKLLLGMGLEVDAIEPNDDMRRACEEELSREPRFHSHSSQAEHTGLADESVDLVVAAQAFHWFDVKEARREFHRILKYPGWVALVWNTRETESPFGKAYERFLESHSIDYPEVRGSGSVVPRLQEFFGSHGFQKKTLPNSQKLDWDAFWGRFLSTSYSPKPGHEKFDPAREALRSLFDAHARGGAVEIVYETEIFYGRLKG
jgi:ubiquinone/menaquinone biosynthesis C-methylase UbiE